MEKSSRRSGYGKMFVCALLVLVCLAMGKCALVLFHDSRPISQITCVLLDRNGMLCSQMFACVLLLLDKQFYDACD